MQYSFANIPLARQSAKTFRQYLSLIGSRSPFFGMRTPASNAALLSTAHHFRCASVYCFKYHRFGGSTCFFSAQVHCRSQLEYQIILPVIPLPRVSSDGHFVQPFTKSFKKRRRQSLRQTKCLSTPPTFLHQNQTRSGSPQCVQFRVHVTSENSIYRSIFIVFA